MSEGQGLGASSGGPVPVLWGASPVKVRGPLSAPVEAILGC